MMPYLNENLLTIKEIKEQFPENCMETFVRSGICYAAMNVSRQMLALEIIKLLLKETELDKVYPEIMKLIPKNEVPKYNDNI